MKKFGIQRIRGKFSQTKGMAKLDKTIAERVPAKLSLKKRHILEGIRRAVKGFHEIFLADLTLHDANRIAKHKGEFILQVRPTGTEFTTVENRGIPHWERHGFPVRYFWGDTVSGTWRELSSRLEAERLFAMFPGRPRPHPTYY